MEPLDHTTLIVEVASSGFAFKNKIKAASIKLLWDKLSDFIAGTLRQQKGVLLPNLGNFRVGPVIGESKKKVRPCFALLEGRYGTVSQERGRYLIGGRTPIVQPNYGLLSTQSGIHRGATQRIVAELLQRLGVHVLSGRPVRCDFPGLGLMHTNRAGRFEFVFEPLVMEHFEREHYALVKEMDMQPEDYEVLKGLQHVNLANPPYIKSPLPSRPQSAMSRPQSAMAGACRISPAQGVNQQRNRLLGQQHAPYSGPVLELFRLCKAADKITAGTVSRLAVDGWLQREARGVVAHLDAGTVLDLLATYSIGNSKKILLYKPMLDAFEALQASHGHVQPQHQHAPEAFGSDEEQLKEPQGHNEHHQQYTHQAEYGSGTHQDPEVLDASFQGMMGGQGGGGAQQAFHHPEPLRPPTAPTEPTEYLHYAQQQLSPRSRSDYDAFNRLRFEQLHQARGPAHKRALTPKVTEEPLNLHEYHAVRQASPTRLSTPGNPFTAVPFSQPQSAQPGGYLRPSPRGRPGHQALDLPPPSQQQPLSSPRHSYRPHDQVAELMHDMSDPVVQQAQRVSKGQPGPAAQPLYQSMQVHAAPSSQASPRGVSPISQYDIINAVKSDRARLKSELASELQQGWQRQIQERQDYERSVVASEFNRWPHLPSSSHDKRPPSAVSRPPTSPRRTHVPLSPQALN